VIARLLAIMGIGWALGFAVYATTLPRPADAAVDTDAIVVLTGGAGRLQRGLDLIARHRARRLFVSGADRTVRKRELAVETHRPQALFDCCVDLGQESVDTRSNARETAGWIARHGYRSLRLITTDWHMPRAHRELAAALPRRFPILVDPVPSEPGFATLFAEYNKYLLRSVAAPFGY
jgi:uncharacterized SAM-binding protein YcdF (DUF218 family)